MADGDATSVPAEPRLLGALARTLLAAAEALAATPLDARQRESACVLARSGRAAADLLGALPADEPAARVPAELADLAAGYLARRATDARALREAAARGDFDRARRLGHDMKGSGAGYGFERVSVLGARLEAAARRGDAASVLAAAEALAACAERELRGD